MASDSERKPAATTWATLSDQQQGFFYVHHSTDKMTHTTAFVTSAVGALAGMSHQGDSVCLFELCGFFSFFRWCFIFYYFNFKLKNNKDN